MLVERLRHRHRPPRPPLRRAEYAAAHLLVDGDRARDHFEILAPAQRLHFPDAQPGLTREADGREISAPSCFAAGRIRTHSLSSQYAVSGRSTLYRPIFRGAMISSRSSA
jgi:hypothetical protein